MSSTSASGALVMMLLVVASQKTTTVAFLSRLTDPHSRHVLHRCNDHHTMKQGRGGGSKMAASTELSSSKASSSSEQDEAFMKQFEQAYVRGEGDYELFRYQYALSSHFQLGYMQPAAIIYPKPGKADEQVIAAIKYARDNKLAIAIRTGGHQYSGASSTYGDNILLDMSEAYLDKPVELDDKGELWFGISFELWELNKVLRNMSLFVPHGQCSHVHTGGHLHTGGYGQLGRAFGLFADHIMELRVITADGEVRNVRRDDSDFEKKQLFYAILGGSPGNYGVVTHIKLKPYKDVDHPSAYGLKVASWYTQEKLTKLLDLVAEINDDPDFPGDVDYCVTVMSEAAVILPSYTGFNRDEQQLLTSLLYHAKPQEQLKLFGDLEEAPVYPAMCLVYVQWANREGKNNEEMPSKVDSFFKDVRKILGLPNNLNFVPPFDDHDDADVDEHTLLGKIEDFLGRHPSHPRVQKIPDVIKNLLGNVRTLNKRIQYFLDSSGSLVLLDGHMKMSRLTRQWIFTNVREYNLPYEKRTWCTRATNLTKTGWASAVAESVDMIQRNSSMGCKVVVQIQPFGGEQSAFYQKGLAGDTAFSWRDSTTVVVLDCFYNPSDPCALAHGVVPEIAARDWQKQNDEMLKGPNGNFSPNEDRRLLWGSYGDYAAGEFNMGNAWPFYYENQTKYDLLCDIKRKLDPNNVFTPNTFCVGVPPTHKQVIEPIDTPDPPFGSDASWAQVLKNRFDQKIASHLKAWGL